MPPATALSLPGMLLLAALLSRVRCSKLPVPVVPVLIGLLLVASVLPVRAANDGDVHQLDEMVVTATRSAARSFDVPTPVSVIGAERLAETAPASVADALDEVPGVSLERAGSWEANPVIRGQGSNRVLVLYDGDRETNLWAGRAALTPFIDVGSIARIEVVKGPASALYGTDALGGVINIITKEVDFADSDTWQFENTVNGRYATIDEGWFGRYELAAGGNGFGFRLGLSGRDADDYEDGNGDEVNNSQFENRNLDFKALYDVTRNHRITAAVRYNEIDDFGVPQKDPASPFSHFDRFDTQSYKLGYEGRELGLFDEVRARLYYVDQDRSFAGNFPSAAQPVYNLKTNDIETAAAGSSLQVTLTPHAAHRLTGGFELVREDTDSSETQVVHRNKDDSIAKRLTFQPVPDADRMHFGIFAQDELLLGERLSLIAGGRYDYFTADADNVTFTDDRFDGKGNLTSAAAATSRFGDESDGAATFNLGLLYALTEYLHLTGTLGSGFRAPDIFERYSTRGGGSQVLLGDPDLDPEYSWNVDAGIKVRCARFRGELNGFYNRVDDYIDTVRQAESFISGIPTYKYTNVQDAELYGFDGAAEVLLTANLTLFGTVAFVVGEDRDSGDRLNNIPPLNGTLGARWEATVGDRLTYWFEAAGEFFDRQDHPAPGEPETAGYGTANLRAGLRLPELGPLHDVMLAVNIENLFDKYYLSHLRQDNMDFIPEPGCNVITSLRFSF
ncbi:MAG: TonB-dependent receptor [Deltaproteobacteria bacterium]|nr:TonB-dependent receptor [Candidatus Anaeroferrophillacea bacterium]